MNKISLICATYNRSITLEQLLNSLTTQTYKNFEIIIVDQNKNGLIDYLCEYYKQYLDLIHLKSDQLGSSTNRNVGIKAASGNILGFPDDDCTYYPDTLEKVVDIFSCSSKVDLVYGRLYNRQKNQNIIRNWPNTSVEITTRFIIHYSGAPVIFTTFKSILFDERLGINQEYGAMEDIDFCYQLFKANKNILYTPEIQILHPEQEILTISLTKSYNYGRGWGAFFAKHFTFKILPLLIGILGYITILFFRDVFLFRSTAKNRFYSLKGRINGFFDYLINYKFRRNNS